MNSNENDYDVYLKQKYKRKKSREFKHDYDEVNHKKKPKKGYNVRDKFDELDYE